MYYFEWIKQTSQTISRKWRPDALKLIFTLYHFKGDNQKAWNPYPKLFCVNGNYSCKLI